MVQVQLEVCCILSVLEAKHVRYSLVPRPLPSYFSVC